MDLYDVRNKLTAGKTIYDLPMRVTFYARVSTEKDEQLHSLKAQVQYYSDFIKANSQWQYIDGYIDEGLSGTKVDKRESFLQMIDDAKLGKFDFIVTKEISRFSRNTLDSIRFTQELLKSGVGVFFQSDNINTLYPDAELRLTIMSSIAQDEVRKISERVKFGLGRSIEKGIVLGNSKIWGYEKKDGKLVIVEKEAEIIRQIFDMYVNEGVGIRTIADILAERGHTNSRGNPFAFTTIKNIISNPKYKGYYCGNKTHKLDYRSNDRKVMESTEWVMYKDETGEIVPAIINEETWDKANKILRERSAKMMSDTPTSYQNKYAYSGKIICMEHNTPYHRTEFKYKSGTREAWRCKKYAEKGKSLCCSPTIYTDELNDIMRQIMNEIKIDKAKIIHDMVKMYSDINMTSNIKGDIAKLQVQINETLSRKDKLLDLSINGRISDDEFEIRNNKFNSEIERLQEHIIQYQQQADKNDDFQRNVEVLRSVIASELTFDDILSDGMVDSLLNRIEVYKTDDKNIVRLKVYLRVVDTAYNYDVMRRRGKASVLTVFCDPQYI